MFHWFTREEDDKLEFKRNRKFEKLPFLGDEEQVSGDFPNQLGSNVKFHTLHSEDANNILSALLEQAERLEAIITEIITLKLDGSCGTIIKGIL